MRTSSSADLRDLDTAGATATRGFRDAYDRLVQARFAYEDLRGRPEHVRELNRARLALDSARQEVVHTRVALPI